MLMFQRASALCRDARYAPYVIAAFSPPAAYADAAYVCCCAAASAAYLRHYACCVSMSLIQHGVNREWTDRPLRLRCWRQRCCCRYASLRACSHTLVLPRRCRAAMLDLLRATMFYALLRACFSVVATLRRLRRYRSRWRAQRRAACRARRRVTCR